MKPITLMMEAVRTSEASVYSNETIRRYILKVSHVSTADMLHYEQTASFFVKIDNQ
jgi:hypothetical protein